MEIYHFVIYCMLLTRALCFIPLDSPSEYSTLSYPLGTDSQIADCSCENGDCVTDNLGNAKCICKAGFALQGQLTCKPCDCGSLGRCIFILTHKSSVPSDQYQYQKKCVCDVGKAEKDGTCVDCFCGNNSACDFDNGERRCFCINGYSEKDGVCTKCDCGFNGECEYHNGNKICDCDEGYLELNGICEECDCGANGTCSFINGQQTCKCEQGFSVNEGKCEQCDCGSNSENCVFVDGVKQCNCNEKYADRYGTCEECYCGKYTKSCNFKDNQKTCSCLEGYVQKGELCEPGCSTDHPCQNGGYCKDGFCFCLNGTRGEFCEEIEDCPNLCLNQSQVECAYDTASRKAFCRCINNKLSYDPITKQCRKGCDEDNDCLNGGKCVIKGVMKFCNCLPGTQGDRCEIVDDCASGSIRCLGDGAFCDFDINARKATCKCKNNSEDYDSRLGKCRYFCKGPSDCFNGGTCVNGGYCSCWRRTHGAQCEIVDDCYSGRLTCGGIAVECVYDVIRFGAACKCKHKNEYYSKWFKRCMRKWWKFSKKNDVNNLDE